jgi:hyaluronate lyase
MTLKWNFFKWTSVMVVIALLVNPLFSPAPAASASGGEDEYDELRARLHEELTGGDDFDPADPDIAPRIASLDEFTESFWNVMDTSADRTYLWSDLASQIGPDMQSNHISGNYDRLQKMATAYGTRGSVYYGNAQLREDIISGMDWMYENRYNTSVPKRGYGNWYDWQIASPISINKVSILLYEYLTPQQLRDWHGVMDWQALSLSPGNVGANRVWSCNILITSGILMKDSAKIQLGVGALSPIFPYVTSGEGTYPDGSFVMHTALIPYNGGYGVSMLDNLTKVMAIVAGSSWDITDPNLDNIYDWVYNSFEPLFYDNSMMTIVTGRNIARIDNGGLTSMGAFGSAVVRLAYTAPDPADAARYKAMVKQWMLEATSDAPYNTLGSIQLVSQTKAIMNDASIQPRGELVLNKQYPSMARAVHRRPDFAFAIGMYSDKIGNYELINGENLKGWHTGAGMTYLYNDDVKQFADAFWPTVNSHRLPGTTVLKDSETPPHVKNGSNWVGGTEVDGLYGVSGMHYVDSLSSVSARKSWFMFDDEVVSLGADIKSSNDTAPVETIVDNRKLNADGTNALTVNGTAKSSSIGWTETMDDVSWVHLEGNAAGTDVGYYFPGGGVQLNGLRESRTANWYSINNYFTDPVKDPAYFEDLTRNYMNLWFDHGTTPSGGSYAYVLLPGKTAAETESYSSNPNIEVLENSAEAQAVRENRLGATGINFWQDAAKTVAGVTSNKKASVMLRTDETGTEISVSDPTMANKGTIELTLDMELGSLAYIDPGVSVGTAGSATTLSIYVDGAGGKSFKARFRAPGEPSVGPEAPAELAVIGVTDRSATLSWSAVEGADDYRLYRAEAATGQFVSVWGLSAGATSYTDTGLASGNHYLYKVVALNADGLSADSNSLSIWTLPAAPTALRIVSATDDAVELAWQAVSGADGYDVSRSESKDGPFFSLNAAPVLGNAYTDSDILSGVNYYYRVAAVNAGGVSRPTAAVPSLFGLQAYLIDENFDAMSQGDLNGQNGWIGNTGGDPVNSVVVRPVEGPSSNQFVKMFTKVDKGTSAAEKTFDVPLSSTLIAEVTAIADDSNWKNALILADGTLVSNSTAAHVVIEKGKMWGYNGGTKTDIMLGIEVGVPYRIKVVVDTAAHKFDVYVDDELRVSGWSYRYAGVGTIDTLVIGNSGNANSSFSFDDVKVSYIPHAPSNLQAAPLSGSSVRLTWNAVPGAEGYRLYRSENPSAGFQRIGGDIAALSFTDEGLSGDTSYFYKIVAFHGGAVSRESSVVSASIVPDSFPADIPAYVIDESFDGLPQGELNGQNGWLVGNGGVAVNTVTVQNVAGGGSGKQVLISTASSQGSAEAYALFQAPQGSLITAEAEFTTGDINWKNALILADGSMTSNSSAVHIVLQNDKIWGYNGGTKTDIMASAPAGALYRLKVVVNSTTRRYDVYVNNELKASGWNYRYNGIGTIDKFSSSIGGNASSMTLDNVRISYALSAPTDLQAMALSSSSIGLTWSAVPGASSYRVYRSAAGASDYEWISPAGLSALSYVDEGLSNGSSYDYLTVAVYGGAVSPVSGIVTATTEAGSEPEPETPAVTLTATASAVLGGEVGLAVGINETEVDGESAIIEAILTYDPAALTFATVENIDSELELDPAAILLPPNGFQLLASGVKPNQGEILVVLAQTSSGVVSAGELFQLRGTVKDDASAGETHVRIASLQLSSEGELIEANTEQAAATIIIKLADTSALEAAIATAGELLAAASPGSLPGQYPQSALDAFADAIAAAKAAGQNDGLTQDGIDAALTALQAAVATFQNSVVPPQLPVTDKTALAAAIQRAQTKLAASAEGDKLGQYPGDAVDALEAAISAAGIVHGNAYATQGAIDHARAAMDTAVVDFAARIVTLVPGQTAVTIRDLSLIAKYYGITSDDPYWELVDKADLFGNRRISLVELAAVARMIVSDWLAE